MSEKDASIWAFMIDYVRQSMPFAYTIFLSTWGGIVNYVTNLRKHQTRFNWRELVFDLIVSTFAGLLTFFFCEWAELPPMLAAILIAISGHMGTRAVAGFETLYNRIIGNAEVGK